jgi:hypothetical protein
MINSPLQTIPAILPATARCTCASSRCAGGFHFLVSALSDATERWAWPSGRWRPCRKNWRRDRTYVKRSLARRGRNRACTSDGANSNHSMGSPFGAWRMTWAGATASLPPLAPAARENMTCSGQIGGQRADVRTQAPLKLISVRAASVSSPAGPRRTTVSKTEMRLPSRWSIAISEHELCSRAQRVMVQCAATRGQVHRGIATGRPLGAGPERAAALRYRWLELG